MIKTDADGGIVVEANGTTYNLSNAESYTAFLMWITSPNEANAVPVSAFEVETCMVILRQRRHDTPSF